MQAKELFTQGFVNGFDIILSVKEFQSFGLDTYWFALFFCGMLWYVAFAVFFLMHALDYRVNRFSNLVIFLLSFSTAHVLYLSLKFIFLQAPEYVATMFPHWAYHIGFTAGFLYMPVLGLLSVLFSEAVKAGFMTAQALLSYTDSFSSVDPLSGRS